MNKELEAFNRITLHTEYDNDGSYDCLNFEDDCKIVEQALNELQTIKNAKPSEVLEKIENNLEHHYPENIRDFNILKQALLKAQEQEELLKTGDLSDGYHTFNQLYYQRCVLFASLVRLNKDKSWKSFKHSDGKYCFDSNGEWFIVGIDTPIGSYTYHYEKKYWYLFECQELECGKEWDGHTEEDVSRLLSLPNEQEKVLKIINEKNVDILDVKIYENYEHYCIAKEDSKLRKDWWLTQEEFDTLKECLK